VEGLGLILDMMLAAMLAYIGGYSLISAIRLNREFRLFDSRILYPANCKPKDCKDPGAFILFILPRLWVLGGLCLALFVATVLANFVKVSFLQNWFGTYVLPFMGVAVLVWYITVNARCAKKFW